LLARMAASIKHRGPDHTGEYVGDDVMLVMNRLAIIDIEGGNQPFISDDGATALVFNGEIYNFNELRQQLASRFAFKTRSDTEVILHGYAMWGDDVFKLLNGIFSIAIFDARQNRLVLARDPIGTKPLYVLPKDGTVFFASELKAFTATRLATRVDTSVVCDFLAAGYVFCPHSALAGAFQVEPGCCVIISNNKIEARRYRELAPCEPQRPAKTQPQYLADTRRALSNAILSQTVADVPYGLLLSSGLDSMAILSTLKQHDAVRNLETFTVTYEESSFAEGAPVSALASKWGFSNRQIVLTDSVLRECLTDLFYTFDNLELFPTAVAIYAVSKLAAGTVKVLLAGNGGDELFGGYPTYAATEIVRKLGPFRPLVGMLHPITSRIPTSDAYLSGTEKLRRFVAGCRYDHKLAHFLWRHVFLPEEIGLLMRKTEAAALAAERLYAPQVRYYDEAKHRGYSGLAQLSYADLRGWLVDHGLTMWDKAGMRWSAEIRVPLVDPAFVDDVLGVPAHIRMRPAGTKAFLRQVLSDSIPAEILARPKQGFQIPISRWLRGPLAVEMRDLCFSLPASLFDHAYIERLWRDFTESRADNALKLWTLGCLAGWASAHDLMWE
jgi:asparagine synthase (glutamine-hydrolysing)